MQQQCQLLTPGATTASRQQTQPTTSAVEQPHVVRHCVVVMLQEWNTGTWWPHVRNPLVSHTMQAPADAAATASQPAATPVTLQARISRKISKQLQDQQHRDGPSSCSI
jgi:hypothetical protein